MNVHICLLLFDSPNTLYTVSKLHSASDFAEKLTNLSQETFPQTPLLNVQMSNYVLQAEILKLRGLLQTSGVTLAYWRRGHPPSPSPDLKQPRATSINSSPPPYNPHNTSSESTLGTARQRYLWSDKFFKTGLQRAHEWTWYTCPKFTSKYHDVRL